MYTYIHCVPHACHYIQWKKQHLHRPVSVRLSDAQVDEAGHRQTHIEPVTEAEIVYELEHILHAQEDQTH